MSLQPFRIEIPETEVAGLKRRIRDTRWPSGVTDSGGIPVAEVQALLEEWAAFDWIAPLNRWPHFMADGIHFVHLQSEKPPLLMLHGWPGSFVELLGVADRLRSTFDIVIPSIPGFGFSTAPVASNRALSDVMADLMSTLGYDRFYVHGGDVGAAIGTWMAVRHPSRVIALHLNYIPGSYVAPGPADPAFEAERTAWFDEHGAYAHIQRTTPLTAAYGPSDSPAALAAWIAEKFQLWSDPSSTIPRESLLTNLSIYWFTNTIASSMRYYLESARTPVRLESCIEIPTHIAHFPHEAPFPPRDYVERGYNVVRWTDMPRGGHFAALEAPDLLATDIVAIAPSPREGGRGWPEAG
jgi:pimeloyl-ACP methyl ester carboxylesterase